MKDPIVKKAWSEWVENCQADGRNGWADLQERAAEAYLSDGEVFPVFAFDKERAKQGKNPLVVHLQGSEMIDESRTGADVFQGIEYDGQQRKAYWFYERSPLPNAIGLRSVRIPASNVVHLYRPLHPGQQRGISPLASILVPAHELQKFLETQQVKQQVGALFVGVVRSQDGSNPLQKTNDVPALEPGAMVRLQGGEDIEFSTPPQSDNQQDSFIKTQMRLIAAGAGIPYEILSGDLSATTFASGRHGLLEWQRQIEVFQYNLMVEQFCKPIFKRWAEIGVAMGLLPNNIETPRWIAPQLAMLDQRSDVAAKLTAVRAGFVSRQEIISQMGESVEQIDAEISEDNKRADRLGLTLDSDPRKTTQQGMEQQSEVSQQQ